VSLPAPTLTLPRKRGKELARTDLRQQAGEGNGKGALAAAGEGNGKGTLAPASREENIDDWHLRESREMK